MPEALEMADCSITLNVVQSGAEFDNVKPTASELERSDSESLAFHPPADCLSSQHWALLRALSLAPECQAY